MQSTTAVSELLQVSGSGESLTIAGPVGVLEARFRAGEDAEARKVAIICHPHPLHGGTMDNKVVTTLARTYSRLGWHSLRFNFRGVGASAGTYGQLKGEIEDLQAVIGFVREQLPGVDICLAGFSFGSAVAANVAVTDESIAHLLLIAPPVGKYDLDFPDSLPVPTLVVQGAVDEIVDLGSTRQWAANMSGKFDYCEMSEAGHFFHGRLTDLSQLVEAKFQPRPYMENRNL